jgi:hypothetical protein
MSVTIETGRTLRRVIATVPPGVRWATFETATLAAITGSPELTDWNWIIDNQGPMDDVDVAGMSRIGEAFRRLAADPQRSTFTVVVSTEPLFAPWARVIDLNFGNRRHLSAPTKASAFALIDSLEASNGPEAPSG